MSKVDKILKVFTSTVADLEKYAAKQDTVADDLSMRIAELESDRGDAVYERERALKYATKIRELFA